MELFFIIVFKNFRYQSQNFIFGFLYKKLKKTTAAILFLSGFLWINAQKDSIYIEARLSDDLRHLQVNQEIIFYNKTEQPIHEIHLLNWISAYKTRGTALAYRKLEDRNSDLHFAKEEDLGKIYNLSVNINGGKSETANSESTENLYFQLPKELAPGEKTVLNLTYELLLPNAIFSGYGTSGKKTALKYFFPVPDSFHERNPTDKYFKDAEETANYNTFWTVNLEVPTNYYSKSNLPEIQPNYFRGNLENDPEILISEINYPEINTVVVGKPVNVSFGYPLTEQEKQNLEFYLPLHLKFIHEKTGVMPEKIYISEKFRKKHDFFGNDDIKFWKFRFEMFGPQQNTDLDYFGIIAQNILDQRFGTYKRDDHWFKNGLKTYLEIQYLKTFYHDAKLLGKLPEASIFGIKPLKFFHAGKLGLIERYGIAYQYMMTQNLDQKIAEPYTALSNINQMIISDFETGSLLNFVSEKMGEKEFHSFLKDYFSKNENGALDTDDFLNALAVRSGYSSAFLQDLFQEKHRVNFNLKKFKRKYGNLQVLVKKNSDLAVPFKLETIKKDGERKTYWFDTPNRNSEEFYIVPESDAEKIVINGGHFFPESNFRDNYLYTRGFFANAKKIRLKLFNDIPNPEFNEIYINPRFNFNAYDKLLMGINFRNEGFFDQKFSYSVTPYFSTGTKKFTGSGGVSYTFMPAESFYRSLSLGVSGSYFHYDYGLSYKKFSAGATMNFTKNPRSDIGRSLGISYNHYQKELTPEMIAKNEYDKYNLWGISYGYRDNRLIHEKYMGLSLQGMEDFQKITAEGYYRYEFAQHKKISFRWFGGYFLNNKTRNSIFDYGISRVSNYSFSYGLIGQSATSGILAQQFILADGGFKSYIGTTANQWITSVNVDSHVWKMFNLYGDAGLYKNKGQDARFIWDTGVKLRLIPDFLEFYLPVYSTLGFEPSFKDYGKRIRFTLVFNLGAITNTLRRGWY